jgi:hypothetical protein
MTAPSSLGLRGAPILSVGVGACLALGTMIGLGLGPAVAADAPQISNFSAGAVCGPKDKQRICFRTSDIYLTDEGDCVFNGAPKKCTWYGFAFDYVVEGDAPADLQCEFSSTIAYDSGNPRALFNRDQFTSAFTVHLLNGAHHFINPQYSTGGASDGKVDRVDEACSYAGSRLFSVEFHMHHAEPST